MPTYPNEFLGRCATCLDNAMLSSKPCQSGPCNGMPRRDDECLVRRCQQAYDREHALSAADGAKP